MREKIIENIVRNSDKVRSFMEIKDLRLKTDKDSDEMELLESLSSLIILMFKNVKYNKEEAIRHNAILCTVESFIDYLDEFIYLYKKNRFTVLNQTARSCMESYLALITILNNEDGIDILMNNSDWQQRRIELDAVEAYNIGDKKKVEKKYKKIVSRRSTEKRMRIPDMVLQYQNTPEYNSKDLYLLFRFLSKESHFNLECEFQKRDAEMDKSMKVKTQRPTVSGHTLPLHLNILTLSIISRLLEYFDITSENID